ncbi:MAG: right-handed parallel beta-helix repeat-containing protein [Acidimicrobiales bacterium]|jgi:hypothetical protein
MRTGARGTGPLVSSVAVAVALVTGPASAGSPALKGFLPPKPVSACGTLAGAGSFYFLTANLGPVSANCLVVTAPHVTLNLEGHTITGIWTKSTSSGLPVAYPYEIGVLIEPTAVGTKVETTVPGAAVDNFTDGIVDQANRAVITGPGLLVDDNAGFGVSLHDATGSVVRKLVIDDSNGAGIGLQLSTGAILRGNMIGSAQIYGIWDQASTGAQIVNNDVGASGTAAIYLGCSDTADLQDLSCGSSSGSEIEHNDLLDNGDYGIAIADENLDNSVQGNTVAGDKTYDLEDENAGCEGGVTPPGNSWSDNTGTANQTTSSSCIG